MCGGYRRPRLAATAVVIFVGVGGVKAARVAAGTVIRLFFLLITIIVRGGGGTGRWVAGGKKIHIYDEKL